MPCQASTTPGKALLQPGDAVHSGNAAPSRLFSTECDATQPGAGTDPFDAGHGDAPMSAPPATGRYAPGGLAHWSAAHRAFGVLLLIHSALMAVAMLAKKHPASAECALDASVALMRDWRTWAVAAAVLLAGMIFTLLVAHRRRRSGA
ncbi:hypothetical protein [Ralstonia pseudosolanacearum]|uniref:hypothetical protein n=2 Tax=Ralstonia pseudosolanacearum TaxID=1310165 RepID=UPI001BDC6C9B|nr:hypothetical protein [Ralstonia pseudosolanacearum]QVX39768.1 hypothetical protein J4H89_06145 [Ralstonia solanacearum]MBX9429346.1 hypothetical protein [Ralstonia pseudosolanacearum]MDO3595885.1 hypothetical protein [Ralstonia pseudosolanacearum]MDO3606597.1 hypothetical protein [Ralstonia pseudosolanacearum]MDO3612512.1 hypothetical protein [Ralstonia pseudosolanacearum]